MTALILLVDVVPDRTKRVSFAFANELVSCLILGATYTEHHSPDWVHPYSRCSIHSCVQVRDLRSCHSRSGDIATQVLSVYQARELISHGVKDGKRYSKGRVISSSSCKLYL